ncbi:MAG: endonuclease MutS2 [Clostridia bacterium]|nr:endonuclease MutS2 [Clostridia bacterium]
MDDRVLKVLEFDKIREMLSQYAICKDTKEMCRAVSPIGDKYEIQRRLSETSEAESIILKHSAPPISPISDVRLHCQRAQQGGTLSMGDLLGVAHVLRTARLLEAYFDDENIAELYPVTAAAIAQIAADKKLEQAISSAILSDEEMSDDASAQLCGIRKRMRALTNKINDVLNDMVRSQRYASFLQDAIITMRGDRFVVPVKAEHKNDIPGIVHDSSASGATLFVEPMAVVQINNQLHALAAEEKTEIERILAEFSGAVGEAADIIKADYNSIICLDFAFAKAKLSRAMRAVEPLINDDGIIDLRKARHPLIASAAVVPIDVLLGNDFDTLVITGPNTGGKTVTLKTVGLLTIMAQSGLHVPAEINSRLSVFEEVFADIGDEQSIEQSLSTFSSHMVNIIDILKRADYKSLVLFDELGAGTDPTEGAALAAAILERVKNVGAKTVATTHYSEIKLYALSADRVENAACEFDVATLRPTYRLLIGVPGKSNAFAISKRLGLEEDVISRAQSLIDGESARFEDVITTLEDSRRKAEKDAATARSTLLENEAMKEKLAAAEKSVRAEREKIIADARRDAKKLYERAKSEADALLKDMQKKLRDVKSENAKEMERDREKLKRSLDAISGAISEDVLKTDNPPIDPQKLKLGQRVEVTTLSQQGEIVTLPDKNGKVTVQVGILKVTVNISALRLLNEKAAAEKSVKAVDSVPAGRSMAAQTQIDVRGQSADEALATVDKFLDDAALASLETVTIVHGKGSGVLRNSIAGMLKRHVHVKEFRLGRYGEGEHGVTIVALK